MDDRESQIAEDVGSRMPLPKGAQIDSYVIDGVLGAGGFGITYLAEHSLLGKKYAIKEYFPQAFSRRDGTTVRPSGSSESTYRKGLESFTAEARALAQFKHPAILDVAGIFEENGTAYIVLAFEPGLQMGEWLRILDRPPTQEEIDAFLEPLLDALEEVHKRNLLHRDIAPDNILIRSNGTPVLIDFGSAREVVRDQQHAVSAIVKQGYSPPEQYATQSSLQGPWTDIYGLAATLYKAMTGQKPPGAMDRMVAELDLSISQTVKTGYRSSFLKAIDHGLRLRPEERPQTVATWRAMVFRGKNRTSYSAASLQVASERGQPRPRSTASRPAAQRSATRMPPSLPHANARPTAAVPTPTRPVRLTETGRPDLSGLDVTSEPSDEPSDEQIEVVINPRMRAVYFGVTGLVCGCIGGALSAVLLASILASRCYADSCLMAYLLPCSIIGSVGGLALAVYFAQDARMQPPERRKIDQ